MVNLCGEIVYNKMNTVRGDCILTNNWRKLCSAYELDLAKTFECGQCFRWDADDKGIYSGVVAGHFAKIKEEDNNIFIKSTNEDHDFWNNYFDLYSDYEIAHKRMQQDEYLRESVDFGRGIRILRQEGWETLCSFIISQCNNIPRIKKIIKNLCEFFGEKKQFEGEVYYTFPSAETVLELGLKELDKIKAGYRVAYLMSAAAAVNSGSLNIELLSELSYLDAKKELLKISGVGEKVANCVLLFGLNKTEAFPEDVWIKKALKEKLSPDFNPQSLGEYAGLAQQYIFFRIREENRLKS